MLNRPSNEAYPALATVAAEREAEAEAREAEADGWLAKIDERLTTAQTRNELSRIAQTIAEGRPWLPYTHGDRAVELFDKRARDLNL